jgi:pilus assembly protein Flp/PilA
MLKTFVLAQTAVLNAKDRLAGLRRDESGAALIEYSLLIGLIVVGAVAAITAVGTKIGGNWTSLKTAIGA